MISRIQLKQTYEEYSWNENRNEEEVESIPTIFWAMTGGGIQREMEGDW